MVVGDGPRRAVQGRDFAGYRTACNVPVCFIQNREKKRKGKPVVTGMQGSSSGFALLCRVSRQGWSARKVEDSAVSFANHKSFCHS